MLAIAIGVLGGTIVEEPPSDLTIALLAVGSVLLVLAGLLLSWTGRVQSTVSLTLLGASVTVLMTMGRFPTTVSAIPEIVVLQLTGAACLLAALVARPNRRLVLQATIVIGIVAFGFVGLRFASSDPIAVDVYLLHEAAADALAAGENPYTTGNVRVLESHTLGGNEWIEEYTYPPLTLIGYAGASLVFGDSRYAGVIAIVATMAVVSLSWVRRHRFEGSVLSAVVIGALLVLPMTYMVLLPAWTEPLALLFLALAALLWRPRPAAAAIMLGLAFASKQYFLVAVPLLFFLPDPYRWKRISIVGATVFLTFIPFLVLDAEGLYRGVVEHHLTRPPRPDSATLAGLGIHVPTGFAIAVAVVVGVLVARRAKGSALALISISATIGVFTLLSVRGFRNSWWLVVATAILALGVGTAEAMVAARQGTTAQRS